MCQTLPLDTSDRVIAEARRWIGTPWRHNARIHGAGVDCLQLLVAVFSAVGLIEAVDTGSYPKDWHLHKNEPRFLSGLLRYAEKIENPEPACIVMFNFGRHAAHGAIYTGNNNIIHAWSEVGMVVETNLENHTLSDRIAGYYRVKS